MSQIKFINKFKKVHYFPQKYKYLIIVIKLIKYIKY